ncbi:MAG: preprotein translocase subunit SecG [Candidatus Dormibacteria bacterium]
MTPPLFALPALIIAAAAHSKFPLHTALQVLVVLDAILLILGVLLQTPRTTGGLGGTIGGGGDSGGGYRTRRGVEKSLFQVTAGLAVLFVVLSVANIKLG